MYKIYMVEDDNGILNAVKESFLKWELDVTGTKDFRGVTNEFLRIKPDLVLMDIGLPSFNGYYWCTEIRRLSNVPIIFLSSTSDNMNMISAMNMGGDDFVVKPFDMDYLVAKVRALLRRTYDLDTSVSTLYAGGAALDIETLTLKYKENTVSLTKNEHRILSVLMENKGKVVSRERLMDALWETESFIDDNTLTVNINRLRKKLDGIGLTDFIATKARVGYYIGKDD